MIAVTDQLDRARRIDKDQRHAFGIVFVLVAA